MSLFFGNNIQFCSCLLNLSISLQLPSGDFKLVTLEFLRERVGLPKILLGDGLAFCIIGWPEPKGIKIPNGEVLREEYHKCKYKEERKLGSGGPPELMTHDSMFIEKV